MTTPGAGTRILFRATCGLACVAASLMALIGPASADYPDRPVHIITPFAAGGGTDVEARIFAAKLNKIFNNAFIVENRPGAGTVIGTQIVARANPDGYTLLYGSPTLTLNPAVRKTLPYDTLMDFQPISLVATQPFVVIVHPSLKMSKISDLVSYAKANPGVLNNASTGTGTVTHLLGEQFKEAIGARMVHVPYTGSGGAASDLLAGRVQVYLGAIASLSQFIRNDLMTALAVSGRQRQPAFPDVATLAEQGVVGFDEAQSWGGFLAPAKTPPEIIATLNKALVEIARDEEARAAIAKVGSTAMATSPEEFAAFIRNEVANWTRLSSAVGLEKED